VIRPSLTRIGGLLVAVCALVARSGAAELPKVGFPQSAGTQLKTHNFTPAVLDKVHKVGFRIVRRGFYWNAVEREKGVYTFDNYDKTMAHAKKLGITVVGVLFGGNSLYENDGRGGIQTDPGRQGFAKFAAALAEHYKDHSVLWELWNEPNVRTFWRKDGKHNSDEFAKEYTDLAKAVVPAMLEADPDCFVMAGSVSNYWRPSYEWTEFCFKRGILKTGIRAWSVHPYGVKTPEEFAVGHAITRNLLKKYGKPDLPMLNTERGFAVKEAPEGWSGGSIKRAREFQAWHFVRQFMVDQLCGIRLTLWYEWAGAKFGVADEGGSRPVYAACKTMFEQLDGYQLVRRVDTGHHLDYVVLMENKDKEKKLVVWTAPPPGDAPDKAFPHQVEIAVGVDGMVAAVDINGGPAAVQADGQKHRVTVSGAPQYLSVPAGATIAARSIPPLKAPVAQAAPPPEGATDLKLFGEGVAWQFVKNTGEGSFEVAKADDGKPIGVLHYDFTKSKSRTTPYVLASAAVSISAGPTQVLVYARSPVKQRLTFRVVDSTGQTHQYKGKIEGTGKWEKISIPLTRRLEHWGGAKDGKIHYPIQSIVFSVPLPNEQHKAGKVEYADAVTVGQRAAPKPAPAAKPAASPAKPGPVGPVDLKLFEPGVEWQFVKNTGEGSFELGKDSDGKPIGVLNYDFTRSKTKGIPYVLAVAPVNIVAGATEIRLSARSPIAQKLTFRVKDSTGQTHQYKGKIEGTGKWETITIPLTRRLEHWGGAKDGKKHFPLTAIVFSVPLPGEENKTGKVEFSDVIAVMPSGS
jgi:hypothetical protein